MRTAATRCGTGAGLRIGPGGLVAGAFAQAPRGGDHSHAAQPMQRYAADDSPLPPEAGRGNAAPMAHALLLAVAAAAFAGSITLGQTPATSPRTPADPVEPFLTAAMPELLGLYQDLHRAPELSFHERATAARLQRELEQLGIAVTANVGGTGLVGVLKNGDGPVVLLRTDMDALPIAEATGLPFASTVRADAADGSPIGVMHACGHDLHMASLVGTARWFAQHKDSFRGTIVFVGQPAEERAGGMKAMLAAGLLERFPRPGFALALHCEPLLETGKVGVRAGPMMAAVDSVDVTLFGRGGHGAAPHRAIDPIVLAAQYVMALQTIVSREIDPVQPALITVGSIHAGNKHNIIPDRCDLQLTVRSYDAAVREHLHAAIVRKAEAVAAGAGAPKPEVTFSEPTGPLANDAGATAIAAAAIRRALGDQNVVEVQPQMVAEDFGQLGTAGVPICMFRVGTTDPARLQRLLAEGNVPGLHTAGFYPDIDVALRTAVRASVAALQAALAR